MRLFLNVVLMLVVIVIMKVLTNQAPTAGESLILGVLVSVITNQEKILRGKK